MSGELNSFPINVQQIQDLPSLVTDGLQFLPIQKDGVTGKTLTKDLPISDATQEVFDILPKTSIYTVHGNPWEVVTRPDGSPWISGDIAINQDSGDYPIYKLAGSDTTSDFDWLFLGTITPIWGQIIGSITDQQDLQSELTNLNKLIGYASSTGIISGGILSINSGDNTKFDYTGGIALFVDNYTDPENPTITKVNFSGATGVTDTYLTSNDTTFLYVTSDGFVHQTNTPLTNAQAREFAHFGEMGHPSRTTQQTANNTAYYIPSPTLQVQDLMVALGMMTISGQDITANGANLNMNISAGSIFALGANYSIDKKDPHVKSLPARTAFTWVRALQTGTFSAANTLDTDNYDLNGVLTSMPSNDWQLKYAFLIANGTVAIQYGQKTYSTLALAKQALGVDPFILNPSIQRLVADGVCVARTAILVKQGATNLSNNSQCIFIDLGKLGFASGGVAGGTTNLQGAYDNSVTPQIVTSVASGSLDIRRGSTSDTDDVFTVQNGAGTGTFTVKGNGNISANELSLSVQLPISEGGTGATTANDALNNLLPNQTGNNGKSLVTDGTNTSWQTISGGGSTIIGTGATGVNGIDVSIGDDAVSSDDGISIGRNTISSGDGIAIGRGTNGINFGIAIGNSSESDGGISIGPDSLSDYGSISIGQGAASSPNGVAIGSFTNGTDSGIAIGNNSDGNTSGTAVGSAAFASIAGVAIGLGADGSNYGVAIGRQCGNGINNRIEIAPINSSSDIRSRISGQSTNTAVQFTIPQSNTAPTNGGTGFNNADGTLPQGMMQWQLNAGGTAISAYVNISGTVTNFPVNTGTVTSVAMSGGTTGLTYSGSPITTSGTITLSGTLGIANGGTGQTTANAAFNALAPSQTSNSGKFLTTDGTNTSWQNQLQLEVQWAGSQPTTTPFFIASISNGLNAIISTENTSPLILTNSGVCVSFSTQISGSAITTVQFSNTKHITSIFNPSSMNALTSLSFPILETAINNFSPSSMSAVTTLDFPLLQTVGGVFAPATMGSLTSLSFPELRTVGNNLGPTAMNSLTTWAFPELIHVYGGFIPSAFLNLTSLSCPELTTIGGVFTPTTMAALTTLDFPQLTTVGGVFTPSGMAALTTFNLPLLSTVGGNFAPVLSALTTMSCPSLVSIAGAFNPSLASCTSLSFPALTTISAGSFTPNNMNSLTTISFPSLTTISSAITITAMSSLTTITLAVLATVNGNITASTSLGNIANVTIGTASTLKNVNGNVVITGQKLTATAVQNILVSLAALNGTGGTTTWGAGRTVNLSGGTSSGVAALTVPAAAARTTLLGRGATVTLNA